MSSVQHLCSRIFKNPRKMPSEPILDNYFNYFTEIEDHFRLRFGGPLMRVSTMDWALIEIWKNAGIPLEAVLRGIDVTFEHYERRPSKTRKINALGFCAQEVLTAAEDMKEAALGTKRESTADTGFQPTEIAGFLRRAAAELQTAELPSRPGISPEAVTHDVAASLVEMAAAIERLSAPPRLEDLERKLTVLEDKLLAILLAAVPDDEVVAVRAQADRELAPYRSKMPTAQVEQLQKQYLHKKLLENYQLPRLSLFYM